MLQPIFGLSVLQLLVTASVPSSLILFALMMEAIISTKTLVLTKATRRHIPEAGILEEWFSAQNSLRLQINDELY
jgi:hypothetical protein